MSTDTRTSAAFDELAALRALVVELRGTVEQQRRSITEQDRAVDEQRRALDEERRVLAETSAAYAALQQQHELLREELALVLRWAYARRRERFVEAAGQKLLFCELESETPPAAEPEPHEESSLPQRPRPRRQPRQLKLEHLPQERIEHDVPESEKVCDGCGRAKAKIGADESKVLNYRPAELTLEVHVLPKYACPCCKDGVTSPAVPPRPLAKSIAGPGLISYIVVSKFGDHLPLYRQEDILVRHGVHIPRSTLCDWVQGTAEVLTPLFALMKRLVLQSSVMWTDDTTVRLLDPQAEGGSRTARFWTYIGDTEHPYTVYDFTPSRQRDGPATFLSRYQGYLHADAYGGYDGIYWESQGQILEVACGAHVRRKFVEAQSHAPADCARMLEWFRQLYDIEDRARELSVADRAALRQSEAVPILSRMKELLDTLAPRALPKSSLGKAVTYARNQWQAFCRYTTDGRLTIDNNVSERTLRAQAIGRKNWLFLGHEQAGSRAAVLLTILAGAKQHRLEPWAYLTDVLLHLACQEKPDLERFLPDRWAATHPEFRLQHRLEESRAKRTRQQARRAARRRNAS